MSLSDYWLLADAQLRLQQCVADMEAMKVGNEIARQNNEPIIYIEDEFLSIVEAIQDIRDDLKKHFTRKIANRKKEKK